MAGGLRQRLGNRIALWRAGRVRAATGFTSQPEPRSIGTFARGRQLIAGNFLFAGHLVEARDTSIWALRAPDAAFAAEVQGFGWLDDLAAVGDAAARKRAQAWTFEWIASQGRGQGAGWTPDLTGRRLIRWINHAVLLLQGQDRAAQAAYFRALTVQVAYLSRQWRQAAAGLARFEALTGLIVAGLALEGVQGQVAPALSALARDCLREVDSEGGIATRNPEELLEVFTLLNWAEMALSEAGRAVPAELTGAIERIAPVLRALRHADGGLARFHGGGRGLEGRLDMALANAGVRRAVGHEPAMGFARLAAGRTTVIVDAAPPAPVGHASTLAFEMTSGRRPVVVNCGSGKPFGAEWELAGRATASHSVLSLDGVSSSRMGRDGGALAERAGVPVCQMVSDGAGHHHSGEHTGWSVTHGLRHARVLSLDGQGRRLTGTDTLVAETPGEQKRFRQMMANRPEGVGFAIRFHLHPDVDATIDLGGTAVSLALKSGEIWVFRHDGRTKLTLEASVHLEKGRLQPRPARQIVLSGVTDGFEMRIGWTLAKAQDTPLAIRDLDREDLPVPV
ncbi:heparinase II/III family protein [Paragemmobacter straminiformis]|uniref:Heparinase II/III family protein n=1 Tax=Paragemmobacter straminiformis TaxID=2045119 RepID=A0A842I7W9_9RHOB|nr:heparinase II/III family protein [Gemmobacter straminiformis]MBC2836172.1 heparinase II/III family protein [Gemmobacter straminiformis]